MPKPRCNGCRVVLTDTNWRPSRQKRCDYICAPCASKQRRKRDAGTRQSVLVAYGGACVCCGCDIPEFLTIDHINGDGAKHREEGPGNRIYRWLKKNGFPKNNFQLLCFNCNCAKGIYGTCPHQKKGRKSRK
jgi:hypothetical protein